MRRSAFRMCITLVLMLSFIQSSVAGTIKRLTLSGESTDGRHTDYTFQIEVPDYVEFGKLGKFAGPGTTFLGYFEIQTGSDPGPKNCYTTLSKGDAVIIEDKSFHCVRIYATNTGQRFYGFRYLLSDRSCLKDEYTKSCYLDLTIASTSKHELAKELFLNFLQQVDSSVAFTWKVVND